MHAELPLVVEAGTVNFGAHTIKRFINLQAQITELIERFNPALIVIETNFMHKNPRSTAALNQLQGAVRLIAALKNIACEFIDNNVAKRVFFKGKSWDAEKNKYVAPSKDQMTSAVTAAVCADSILPSDGHQDGYDAIALAMAYYEAPVTPIVLPRRPT